MPNQLPTILTRGVSEVLPSANSLAKLLSERKIRVYLGIDPTGSFLTLGHSVVLRKLQQFADLGHEVILLIGNGTVRIGDPTGRDTTRPVLTDEQIQENFKDWKRQASKILDFDKITIRHNGDWLDKLSFTDVVKLMAKTTVQQLIERDMFQDRLKKGLPIFGHEIMYPLLQGYDSVAMDVDLEIGGTDQTFNMMMGRQLQQQYNNREKWVLSTPIIVGTDGRKMSKSFGNYIALLDEANEMYGKLMSITDNVIIEYFTVLTDVPDAEIAGMKRELEAGANPIAFKKKLALTITKMYHTEQDALAAEKFFEDTVQNKQVPDNAPRITFATQRLSLLDMLVTCLPDESKSNLRRLVSQKSIELLPSGDKPTDEKQMIDLSAVQAIRVGKLRYFIPQV